MRVMIAAGGTGGHLFPAEALGRALGARGHAVELMTDPRTAESARERFSRVHVVPSAGLVGRSLRRRAAGAAALASGTWQARGLLAAARPDAVVGFGGYPSVPPLLASRLLRRRPAVLLHDQNAVLGAANRLLARGCDAVATSFPSVRGVPAGSRAVAVGNPVRDAMFDVGDYVPPTGEVFELLVMGGSLGARVFSDVVPQVLASVAAARPGLRVRVSQQARPEDVERVREAYAGSGIEAKVSPFFADVAALLGRAHLVIARSGGSTVAELAASGRPSILVPLPIAAGDEQSANAAFLVEAGAAWSVRQPLFSQAWLLGTLGELLDAPSMLENAARAARSLARPGAAENLAVLIEDVTSARYDVKRPIRGPESRDGERVG